MSAARAASASSRPSRASSRFTSHLGWLYRMERYWTSSRSWMTGRLYLFREICRSTAFTSPAACPRLESLASSTELLTAALSGTLSRKRI